MKKLIYYLASLLSITLTACGGAFQQKVNVGPGAGTVEDHTFEILLMLGVAFALGLWLGWILWNKFKLMVDKLRMENQTLVETVKNLQTDLASSKAQLATTRSELTIANEKNNQISSENLILQGKLADLELDYSNLEAAKIRLDSELSQSIASTPESADVPMEVVTSPVDILLEDLAEVSEDSPAQDEIEPAVLIESLAPELSEIEIPEKINLPEPELPIIELPDIHLHSLTDLPNIESPQSELIESEKLEVDAPEIEEITETVIIPVGEPKVILTATENFSATTDDTIADAATEATDETAAEIIEKPTETAAEIIIEEPVVVEQPATEPTTADRIEEETEEVPLMNLTDYSTPLVVPTPTERRDDLKVVEGIGPKIEQMLYRHGVYSFSQLAATPVNRLKEMLTTEGPSYAMHDPGTWPAQALLAANAEWENLRAYQSFLNAGKRPN